MKKPFFLLIPFFLLMALVLASIWNVLTQSLGYIPAFGLREPTFGYYARVLKDPGFLSSVLVSLKISVWSAVISTVLGVLLSMALIQCGKQRGGHVFAVRIPVLVPHAVAAVFMIQIFSQTGLLARLAFVLGLIEEPTAFPQLLFTPSYGGTILAYIWKEAPFVAYFVLAFMGGIRSSLGEAAENLGASPVRSFFEITLPLSLPAILKAFLIIFIFTFGGYELPFLLGSTLPKALPVQAYLSYQSPDLLQRPYAMAMNGVILLLSCSMALLYALLTARLSKRIGGGRQG